MRSNTYIKFENFSKEKKGYLETSQLLHAGFSNRQISFLEKEGYLEKICHGYYWLKSQDYNKPTDYMCIEACLSAPNAVICMGSALYYHMIAHAEPAYLTVATKRTDRSLLKMNFPVKRHYFSENHFDMGITRKETEFGYYNIYDVERSICDIIRLKSDVNFENIINLTRNELQYERLLKYAKSLKVKQIYQTNQKIHL